MTPHTCPRCGGECELQCFSAAPDVVHAFFHGTLFRVAGNPVKVVTRACPTCKGQGIVWEQDQNGSKPRPVPGDKLEKIV